MKSKDAIEQTMDLMILEAATELCDICEDDSKNKIIFSDEHNKKMKKLFKKEKRDNKILRISSFVKFTAKVACIAIMCFLLVGVSTGKAREWIDRTISFIFRLGEQNSTYNITNDGMRIDFIGGVMIGYIPDNFELYEKEEAKNWIIFTFKEGNDRYFQMIFSRTTVKGRVDSEDGVASDIYINGVIGKFVKTNKEVSITWNLDDCCMNVIGNIDEKEIIKICKSVKK